MGARAAKVEHRGSARGRSVGQALGFLNRWGSTPGGLPSFPVGAALGVIGESDPGICVRFPPRVEASSALELLIGAKLSPTAPGSTPWLRTEGAYTGPVGARRAECEFRNYLTYFFPSYLVPDPLRLLAGEPSVSAKIEPNPILNHPLPTRPCKLSGTYAPVSSGFPVTSRPAKMW